MSGADPFPEWYRSWFGEEYLALYPHRDAEEAEAGVKLVLEIYGRPSGPILDLACGAGRHLMEFEDRGLTAIGLDLSAELLQTAAERRPGLRLVRGDMRDLPFDEGSFECVTNFFTSFGYFAEPEDDRQVLEEIHRTLREGGWFALDFLNAERVREGLVEEDERQLGERRVVQRRRLEEEGRVVVKEIEILAPGGDTNRTFHERVRLYGPKELEALLREVGLEVEHLFGDYSGRSFAGDAPRCILLGRHA